jgi:hypothetical protein
MIDLGDKVKDRISGFTGIALAKSEGLYEATQFRIHSEDLDSTGKVRDGVWIEAERLELLESDKHVGFVHIKGKK